MNNKRSVVGSAQAQLRPSGKGECFRAWRVRSLLSLMVFLSFTSNCNKQELYVLGIEHLLQAGPSKCFM